LSSLRLTRLSHGDGLGAAPRSMKASVAIMNDSPIQN
jgi:hypothetical protein